ncbi:hypothetical protein HPB52_011446 [Rhipicephalus sanguineus]|uniref:Uncharacterized protein n=1 Tax=Rhipicephalus sanguineus TaxID=34632 RepID=A0A9D4SP40_RHISA|nr:hypothetical protein HPB52_011446 [Rhipicephalus sanguineus]
MCGGNDALDARAVTAALTHIVKEKALPSKDMGIRDENIEEEAVYIPEDVIEELEALREPPRKSPNSVAYSGLLYVESKPGATTAAAEADASSLGSAEDSGKGSSTSEEDGAVPVVF